MCSQQHVSDGGDTTEATGSSADAVQQLVATRERERGNKKIKKVSPKVISYWADWTITQCRSVLLGWTNAHRCEFDIWNVTPCKVCSLWERGALMRLARVSDPHEAMSHFPLMRSVFFILTTNASWVRSWGFGCFKKKKKSLSLLDVKHTPR